MLAEMLRGRTYRRAINAPFDKEELIPHEPRPYHLLLFYQ